MADAEAKAESLVEQGLQLYSRGELDEAIGKWRAALEQVPDHARAKDYIKYVEENREALEASFDLAQSDDEDADAGPDQPEQREQPAGGDDEGEAPPAKPRRPLQFPPDGDPTKTLPLGIEVTARMDVDQLKSKVDATKRRTSPGVKVRERRTPAYDSGALGSSPRPRRPTPLVVVPGDGAPPDNGFEPMEKTPVGVKLPKPARLVSEDFKPEQPTPVVPPADLFEEDARPSSEPAEGDDRIASMLSGARQLHEQGTYEGSLWLCERVLSLDPANQTAQQLLENNRAVLLGQFNERIGDATLVPVVRIPQHEIMWHKLDHRAGFLLSRIDGQLTFEDVIDVSGMGEFEASRILAQLLSLGVIGPRSG
jgi:tetratricopeptide (TPR) repeat protein